MRGHKSAYLTVLRDQRVDKLLDFGLRLGAVTGHEAIKKLCCCCCRYICSCECRFAFNTKNLHTHPV